MHQNRGDRVLGGTLTHALIAAVIRHGDDRKMMKQDGLKSALTSLTNLERNFANWVSLRH